MHHFGAWWLVVGALATYRLTRLVTEDTILDRPREAVHRRAARTGHTKFSYFVTCPWCTSIYLAAVVIVLSVFAESWFAYIAVALAFSAVAGVIASKVG